MKRQHLLAAFCAAATLSLAGSAHAQQANGRALNMVRQAMEDYQNLELTAARNRLALALRACGPSACSPATLARVHLALGVIALGGQHNEAEGLAEFTAALRLDPAVAPEPAVSSRAINNALARARQNAHLAAAPAPAPVVEEPPAPAPAPVEPAPAPVEPAAAPPPAVAEGDDRYTFGVELGATLGAFSLGAGDPTVLGSTPPYPTRYAEGNYAYVYPVADPNNPGSYVYRPATTAEATDPTSAALPTRQIPTAVSDADPSARTSCGYVPPGPAGSPATDYSYNRLQCPALRTMRSAAAGAININLRFAPFRGPLGRYFGFSLGLRISPDFAAVVPGTYAGYYATSLLPAILPFMAILARVNLGLYNPHARSGLSLYAYVGGGVGQMQVRAPQDPMLSGPSAHLQGGPGNLNFGMRAEYGFARYVHVAVELGPNFNFPFFLFNFDMTVLAGAHF